MSISFFRQPSCRILIVSGACRTGKTTLSKSIAQQDHFEFLDEPWLPMFLPIIVHMGLCDASLGKALIASYFDELCNDVVLYRRSNFRPGDMSTIWKFKSVEHVLRRLVDISSRQDVVEHVNKNDVTLVVGLPEVTPFISFFLEAIKRIKVIDLVRSPEALAAEISGKNWYGDDQLKKPINNQPFSEFIYQGCTYYMPWWVDSNDFEQFLQLDDYQRGMVYSNFFNTHSKRLSSMFGDEGSRNVLTLRTEEFFENSEKVLDRVAAFLLGKTA